MSWHRCTISALPTLHIAYYQWRLKFILARQLHQLFDIMNVFLHILSFPLRPVGPSWNGSLKETGQDGPDECKRVRTGVRQEKPDRTGEIPGYLSDRSWSCVMTPQHSSDRPPPPAPQVTEPRCLLTKLCNTIFNVKIRAAHQRPSVTCDWIGRVRLIVMFDVSFYSQNPMVVYQVMWASVRGSAYHFQVKARPDQVQLI